MNFTSIKLIKVILLTPAALIALMQRVLSPVLLIRTSGMDTSRIGWFHILNWHLRTTKPTPHSFDIFFEKRSIPAQANPIFINMWRNYVRIVPFRYLWEVVHKINGWLPGNNYTFDLPKGFSFSDEDFCKKFKNSRPIVLQLNKKETFYAEQEMKTINLAGEFVCFHNRDAGFLKKSVSSYDWSYHDHRDSNIQNYALAIKYLVKQDLSCIRLGTLTSDLLEPGFQKYVVRYQGTEKQNDLLDLYLASRCKFFITTDSGINILPYMFNRPVVLLNWINLTNLLRYLPNTICIPKMYFNTDTGQVYDFFDMLYGDCKDIIRQEQLDAKNIQIVENSPNEIIDAVREMQMRQADLLVDSNADKIRQENIWKLYKQSAHRSPSFRIGANFLAKHEKLLERSYKKLMAS